MIPIYTYQILTARAKCSFGGENFYHPPFFVCLDKDLPAQEVQGHKLLGSNMQPRATLCYIFDLIRDPVELHSNIH